MKTKHYLTLASAALGMAAATTAFAEDGYAAPDHWPAPTMEHNMGMGLFDRLEYTVPDKGQDAVVWTFKAGMAVISTVFT